MSEPAQLSSINSPSNLPALFHFTVQVFSNAQACRLIFYPT